MNWILAAAAILMTAGLVCSAELWRRGVNAADDEIMDRAERGDNGGWLLLLMVALSGAGYVLMQIGGQ